MDEVVFIVGKHLLTTVEGSTWDLIGVFDEEKDAVEACIDDAYFVSPVCSNVILPREQMEWPNLYFPKKKEHSKPVLPFLAGLA